MTVPELDNEYFEWMCQLISNSENYGMLLNYLYMRDFEYSIPRDGNRAEDGIELRYRFGYERNYDTATISIHLNQSPCSVLEMMLALALRCEEHIMGDSDVGDRTSFWFWKMIENLELDGMTDDRFDISYARIVIGNFLERTFQKNGSGGLFVVSNPNLDMRTMEIWYQMCYYLDELIQANDICGKDDL